MVRNPIVVRVARAMVFWWLVLTAVTFSSFELIGNVDFGDISQRLMLALAGTAAAGALLATVNAARRELVKHRLLQGERRGLITSIGPVPEGLGVPPRLPGSRLDLERTHPLRAWAGRVRETHPELHSLFSAIVDTMAAYPDCPAAPVRTGHGGRTLFEHSLVVVEQIVVLARTFQFDGGRSKDGRLVAPILDPQFQFDPDDPLIVLLAFAHDLGKLECYRRDATTGRIEELHRDHDRIGRLMLARMPELWALENPDRQALLYAVGYYHRPQDMPKYVDDRARALMELLIVADNAAGKYETAHPVWARAPAPALGTASVAAAELPDDLSQASAPEPLAPTTTVHPENELDSWETTLVEAFLSVIALPQAINREEKRGGLAYRWDNLLYFEEHRLRAAIARELDDEALVRTKKGDGRFQVTEDLMRALLKLGVLYREHEGLTFSEKRAIYRVNWLMGRNDETGTRVYDRVDEKYTSEATIIVKVEGPVAARVHAGNCRLKPRIVGPLYGKSSAINKSASSALAGTAAETPPIDDDDSDEGDGEAIGASSEATSESALADIAQVDDPVAPPVSTAQATDCGDHAGASLLALVDAARALESPPELNEPAEQSSAPRTLPVKPIETAELRARIDLVDGPAGVIAFDGHDYRGRAIRLDQATVYADLIAALEADVTGECRVVREPDCILLMIRDHEKAKNVRRTDIGVAA